MHIHAMSVVIHVLWGLQIVKKLYDLDKRGVKRRSKFLVKMPSCKRLDLKEKENLINEASQPQLLS